MTALILPCCVALVGAGVDVGNCMKTGMELQRIADVAAMAGAAKYAASGNTTAALTTAANLAEVNGMPAGTRSVTGTTLTDTYKTYSVTATLNSSPASATVSVQQAVPLYFISVLTGAYTKTLSASATAQVYNPASSSHACVLGLNGLATGVTTDNDITINGSATSITATSCDLRSEGAITFNGKPTVNVAHLLASGSVSSSYCPTGSSTCQQNLPQIPDPLAGAYASAFATMTSMRSSTAASDPTQSSTPTTTKETDQCTGSSAGTVTVIQPSSATSPPTTYAGLNFNSNTNYKLASGIYYVLGSVTINKNTCVTGTNITIISLGSLQINGNASVYLSAPTSGTTAGLVYGNAASSDPGVTIDGNATVTMSGLFYAPTAAAQFTGNADKSSTNQCLVVEASSVKFAGSSSLTDSGCAAWGVPTIYSMPGKVKLVQ